MPIDYEISKIVIDSFRGIDSLEINFHKGYPTCLIGANNAGKSTILRAVALALNAGGSHQWDFGESDFFFDADNGRRSSFTVKLFFKADEQMSLPAVQGVGQPILVHGAQAKGTISKAGKIRVTRSLFGADGKAITYSKSTPISKADKEKWNDHHLGYRPVNARIEDISDNAPDVWLFTPQNIEASLYIWKTGPISRLARYLAEKFLHDDWRLTLESGQERKMPEALHKAYEFLEHAVTSFPFWRDSMKPNLESTFRRYVGAQASIDLRPSVKSVEQWLTELLAIDMAVDPNSAPTPLRDMGDGWQSLIRLAALEALTMYPDLTKDRLVLLIEEPETHLHPHLRRRMRKILGILASKGWTVIFTSHSSELVSFDEPQTIVRLVRKRGRVSINQLSTDKLENAAKDQAKLDQTGAHEFLFGNGIIICEGIDDRVAIGRALELIGVDCDARSISITQCGSVTAIPSFARIASSLGIRWCAITDEDVLPDGSINPVTQKQRDELNQIKGKADSLVTWAGSLEVCFGITQGKAKPEVTLKALSNDDWRERYINFNISLQEVSDWIDPSRTSSDFP